MSPDTHGNSDRRYPCNHQRDQAKRKFAFSFVVYGKVLLDRTCRLNPTDVCALQPEWYLEA